MGLPVLSCVIGMIPEKLIERLKRIGLDETIYDSRTKKCVLSREHVDLEKVPWYEHAYFLEENNDGNTKGVSKGSFIFDPVSIVPCLALAPKKEDRILDMCAAPGTKTFILSFLTNNEAKIVANDISRQRVKRLRFNVEKFHLSVDVWNKSGRKIYEKFDRILLDAPCSGEGMVNKSEKLFKHWSEKRVKDLAKKQKRLVKHAYSILNPGGTLVYSTCTFEREENEKVIEFLLEKTDAKLDDINVKINHIPGITDSTKQCMRIYPEHNQTGGFFVAKIMKF